MIFWHDCVLWRQCHCSDGDSNLCSGLFYKSVKWFCEDLCDRFVYALCHQTNQCLCFIDSMVIFDEITLVNRAVISVPFCLRQPVFRKRHLKYMYLQDDRHHSKFFILLSAEANGGTSKCFTQKYDLLSHVRLTLITLGAQWEQIVLECLQLFTDFQRDQI